MSKSAKKPAKSPLSVRAAKLMSALPPKATADFADRSGS
jgi:hypothetical protein